MRLLALGLCLLAQGALAKEDDEPVIEEPTPTVQINPEGSYQGVAPGAGNLPPKAPKLPIKHGPQRLTWSGFQVKDGTPTIFLQLTAVPSYHVDAARGRLVVTLKNTRIPVKNNRRPLRVEAFGTDVVRIEPQPHGRDARVVIHVKGDAAAPVHKERIEAGEGGFQFLVIELGK